MTPGFPSGQLGIYIKKTQMAMKQISNAGQESKVFCLIHLLTDFHPRLHLHFHIEINTLSILVFYLQLLSRLYIEC